MTYICYAFYWIIQLTWGALQSILGLIYLVKYRKCKHVFYHGSLLTYHDEDWGGISLGPFIFVNKNRWDFWIKEAAVHEYGHTIQSLIFGPLYLFVIGLPSALWCYSKKYSKLRENGEMNYFDLYCESSANTLGALITKEPKPLREHTKEELDRKEREMQNG